MAAAPIDDREIKPASRRRRRRRRHSKSLRSLISGTDRKWLWVGAAFPVLAISIGVGLAEFNRTPPAPVIDTRPPIVSTPMVTCPDAKSGLPPLLRAAACGDERALEQALAKGAAPDQSDPRMQFAGRTALHHAAQRRHPDMVDTLLEAGADSNAVDAYGNTPLHLIVLSHHHRNDAPIARMLLRSGANVELRNTRHLTPLEELELDHSQLVHRQNFAHVLISRSRELSPMVVLADNDEAREESSTGFPPAFGERIDNGGFLEVQPDLAAASLSNARSAVRLALAGWAEAWSKRDPAAFLAHYAEDFAPPDGTPPELWRESRRNQLMQAQEIRLKLSKMEISINGDEATVRFEQDLDQGGTHTNARRTMIFGKRGGQWLIVAERSAT